MPDNIIEKTVRVIEYLIALARVNTKIVRSVDEYNNILWVHSIPHEQKHCFTQAWGKEEEHADEIWMEVKKFFEPKLPSVPDICRDWIKSEELRNPDDIPSLHESISIQKENYDVETGEKFFGSEMLSLSDYPQVQTAWDTYLDKNWLPWTENYNRFTRVQNVYANLFRIYQEQQKLGEQYELIFCIGLLTWRTPEGHEVKRHLIAARVSLEFEPHLGKFTVRPVIEPDQIDVEFDMLEITEQPSNTRDLIKEGRKIFQGDLWERPGVDSLLTAIANSLAESGEGEYYKDRMEPQLGSVTSKPVIEYAPALILRKRSMRSLIQLLANMKEQIEAGETIPHEFLDLCENLGTPEEHENKSGEDERLVGETEIYFPLPANDEQRRIILTLNHQKGVLVQGPPGTGKSHTIANLICHLLATGQRVLVTAKTPRALQVLHDKLPSEIKPLCINLLGSSIEERESLENSVAGILNKLDKKDELNAFGRINTLEQQIQLNRSFKNETDTKLMALRESETYKHIVADGFYKGTAAEIARSLKKDEEKYAWFNDQISHNSVLPLSCEEITCLCRDFLEIDSETERELISFLPDPDMNLPSADNLRSLFLEEETTKQRISENVNHLKTPEGRTLLGSDSEKIRLFAKSLDELKKAVEKTLKRPMPWITRAVEDVLNDKATPWKELFKLSSSQVESINEVVTKVDSFDVIIPADLDKKKLLNDAKALKDHFNNGGGMGFWTFKPKTVREHGEFLHQVRVDGMKCVSPAILQKLIEYLTVDQTLEYTWSLWSGKEERKKGRFPLQVAQIKDLNEALKSVLWLYDLKFKVTECLDKIKGLSISNWDKVEFLHGVLETCQTVLSQFYLASLSKQIERLYGQLSALAKSNHVHRIFNEITGTFKARDVDRYSQLVEQVKELRQKATAIKKKHERINKILMVAPKLGEILAYCNEPDLWADRLKYFNKAWDFARGMSWLNDFLGADSESLERNSRRLEEDIRKDLAELAALRAWKFCFSRMKEEHRRHLMGWQQSIKKLGKGTGKYAHTHRQNAQRHLNECRDAVPAWIMPLHRVYETVAAGPGIFDVIIVDEASQCGPEALPLFYLGKRILVVGDDKQISPEAVGVERSQVHRLMRDYLFDFEHADSFDVENSLFDHGRIRFSNRITLREHFRCMPEIIHFSNDLCYQADPLIPLRQYPPDRLEPLKPKFIAKGFREGSGQRVINRFEAESLVEAVVSCCQDHHYQGMSMGVIVLQGEAQAYLIEDMLLKRIGAEEMEKRRLICGNPYSFQGDERDVMFLSMVSAPNETIGVLGQAADQRRFNVAASRAKDQMWLFHSVTSNHLSEHCLRRRLLEYFYNPKSQISQALGENADELREKAFRSNRMIERPPHPFDSWFEVDVALAIAGLGYRVVPQFEFADKRIDLVVQGGKAQLAVECDGDFWHGADEFVADIERQRKLERCGWRFYRIRESSYYAAPKNELEPLRGLLEKMGIQTVMAEADEQEKIDKDLLDQEEKFVEEEYPEENVYNNDEGIGEENGHEFRLSSEMNLEGIPNNIHKAMRVKSDILGKTIIEILYERPNFSCMRANVPTYILKRWNLRTRGLPREQFGRKVDDLIAVMARKGFVTIYKSKNVRVKIGWERYPGFKIA